MSPEECFDKLEQLILDENELVTYKLLSKELKIHVNEAKKRLYEFLTTQNSKGEVKLFANYFLSGFIVKDGFRFRKVIIVSEEKLEQLKKEFDEVITIHIYSVNKGECRDASSLYNSQSWCKKWAEEHREYSAIKHPNVKIQTPIITKAEVKKSEAKIISSKPVPIKVKNEGVPSLFQSNKKKDVKSNSTSSNGEKSTSEIASVSDSLVAESKPTDCAKLNSENKDPKKSTLSSLWQKLEDKTKEEKNGISKTESKGKKSQASSKIVGKNNIMSMFSKQAERNAANPVKKQPDPVLSPEKPMDTSISPKVEKETNNVAIAKNRSKSSQRKTKRPTKPVSDNDSEEDVKPKKKKHRRICTMDDSDSESENEEELDKAQRLLTAAENEDVPASLNDDDEEEPIPPTPPVLPTKGKKKVWKTVQKTYQDEDGFLVAKQEKVLVSGSDSDEDPLPKKKKTSNEDPKQSTFSYRKQASLTSFFKQR